MRRIENSLLIRSSMILLVTRIAIKSWMSVNFARLGRRTSELLALEPRHEKTNILHMRKQRRRSASR